MPDSSRKIDANPTHWRGAAARGIPVDAWVDTATRSVPRAPADGPPHAIPKRPAEGRPTARGLRRAAGIRRSDTGKISDEGE
jgi:hypothetical protein